MEAISDSLTALVFTDVVGVAALEQGEGVVERICQLVRARVGEHGGDFVKQGDDDTLSTFPTALGAVSCAVAVQSRIAEQNQDLPAERADRLVQYRVGIELGDVRVEGDRIYGSAVNIAARLEALAPPGGVCISGAIWDQVRFQLEQPFEDLGRQSLKNIPHAVRAYRWRAPSTEPSSLPLKRRAIGLTVACVGLLCTVAWLALRG